MIGEQLLEINAGAVLAAFERDRTSLELRTVSLGHGLLDLLLELGLDLLAGLDVGPYGN
ncbi:hypothetical protein PT2222_200166 [Paraburkholderia tropica]